MASSNWDDRLSALPDDLIFRILYFLPTKTSVSTSVLAQRWRLTWAHVAKLDFDSQKQHIISRVMMRLKSQDLNAFRLSNGDCGSYDLESLVTTLMDRRVQKLTIQMTQNPKWESEWSRRKEYCGYCYDDGVNLDELLIELHRRLFSCKTLVELSLANCQLNVPMTGSSIYLLPALKSLLLENVKYESWESLPRLISRCPVLVKLNILIDHSDEMDYCYISSPTIKELVLRNLDMDELKLDTPALRYLYLLGCSAVNPSAGVLPALTRARVIFNPKRVVDYHKVLRFVFGLYNAKSLKVSVFKMKIPDSVFSAFNHIIKFHNLTQLKLDTDYRFIPISLESADNIQVLTISCGDNDFKCWEEIEQVPPCLVSSLQILKIVHFGCTVEQEFNMVRYFLRNAKVLKKMEICCKHRGLEAGKRNEAHKRISSFERVSEACELVFL